MRTSVSFVITELSQAGEARRFANRLALEKLGFNETEGGKVSIVVTEIATNLVKHAGGGELIFRTLEHGQTKGIEVLALDKGEGMMNIAECLRDGYSTAGSPGNGLGAIQRLSTLFEINSVPGIGTAVVSQLWKSALPRPSVPPSIELGVISIPIRGEQVCGDSWATGTHNSNFHAIVADGLGHGILAAEASTEAITIFEKSLSQTPQNILRITHDALRKTRGAAVAIATLNTQEMEVRYSGLGNVNAVIVSSGRKSQSLVSNNGTAGADFFKTSEFNYCWSKDSVLIMHSDGISARWHLDRYPGLLTRHPSLIAGVLYRDYKRGTDDSTILVIREARR
jgi:anti-sigma regulatory factor (Ser/Thr protein kinase)